MRREIFLTATPPTALWVREICAVIGMSTRLLFLAELLLGVSWITEITETLFQRVLNHPLTLLTNGPTVDSYASNSSIGRYGCTYG